jgi:hypothetical protein
VLPKALFCSMELLSKLSFPSSRCPISELYLALRTVFAFA